MVNKGSGGLPLVALVGRPNVGKSTLFNRLVGQRRALVDDQPGVTRDRNYGRYDWAGSVWRVVDTGGFEPKTDDDVLRAMRRQTEFAIAEADAVVFILDGKEGLTPSDREVSKLLRKSGKLVLYAVNKVDGQRHEEKTVDFFGLGVDKLISLSAEHGYGIDDLLDAIAAVLPGVREAELDEEEQAGELVPRVAVVGKPNVGKSTLINALLGQERLLVHPQPGTTRDTVDSEVNLGGHDFVFIDTAGMRKQKKIDDRLERFSVMRAVETLERCHVAIVLMDAAEGIVDQDAKIAGLAHERGRAVILGFNKWDLIADKEARRRELDDLVEQRLPHVNYAPILTISAQEGVRLGKLPGLLMEVWEHYNLRVPTGELNRRLEVWTTTHHPPTPSGRAVKIHYCTQSNVRPPTFVFFTNHPDYITPSYQRYLANQLRADFNFIGSPLRILFRGQKKADRK
jgi:GTPase